MASTDLHKVYFRTKGKLQWVPSSAPPASLRECEQGVAAAAAFLPNHEFQIVNCLTGKPVVAKKVNTQ